MLYKLFVLFILDLFFIPFILFTSFISLYLFIFFITIYIFLMIVSPKKHYRPCVRTYADIGQVPKEGWRQEGHPASKTSCFINQCMDSFGHSTITLGATKRADA